MGKKDISAGREEGIGAVTAPGRDLLPGPRSRRSLARGEGRASKGGRVRAGNYKSRGGSGSQPLNISKTGIGKIERACLFSISREGEEKKRKI